MNCPTCGQSVDNNLIGTLRILDWDDLLWNGVGHTEWNESLSDYVTVTAVKEADVDSYGYVNDENVWLILKVGDRHLKREATESSYGGRTWDAEIREVKSKPRTITVFDYL